MRFNKFIDYVVDNAKAENLKVFIKLALEHLQKDGYGDDRLLEAFEIISGVSKPNTAQDFDETKILNYINAFAYKGTTAKTFTIQVIDNFTRTVKIEYPMDNEPDKKYSIDIYIGEVLRNVK